MRSIPSGPFRFGYVHIYVCAFVIALIASASLRAASIMENLGRGVVATRTSETDILVSWRLLGHDPEAVAFNVYRTADDTTLKLNAEPLIAGTNFVDSTATASVSNSYHVAPVMNGLELAPSAAFTLPANTSVRPYLAITMIPRPGYYVQHAWVGDLDGNGEYDLVIARLPAGGNNNQFVEAYKQDGTFLWSIDLGPQSRDHDNITPGPATISVGHNDGLTVYDLNSDGKAEVVLKTANGVIFGDGTTLTHSNNLDQYISVLDGMTGAEIARDQIPTDFIGNGTITGHFGVMYADGVKPTFVYRASNRRASGPFDVMFVTWDLTPSGLQLRWKWRKDQHGGDRLADAHQIRVLDVNGDGKDDVTPGGYMISSEGQLLWALDPEVVHGDRYHITDIDPSRPGLEGFYIQQSNPSLLGMVYFDAQTGEILRKHYIDSLGDLGRGTVADIDPRFPGNEYWSFTGIFNAATGQMISPEPQRPWPNFRIWWDGTVMSNLFNHVTVDRWDYINRTPVRLLSAGNYGAVRTTRDASPFYGDILGDWREEIIYENNTNTQLMIFTTPYPSDVRLYTLPHNRAYRTAMALKGYMQSHHPDYYLGNGMEKPPRPSIRLIDTAPAIAAISPDTGRSASDFVTSHGNLVLSGTVAPGASAKLVRAGAGEIATLAVDSNGAWSYDYTATALASGAHYFEVVATLGGIESRSPIVGITIDQDEPAAPIIARIDGATGAYHGLAEAGSLVSVFADGTKLGEALADANGRWSLELDSLPSGQVTVTAVAADQAGNASAPSTGLILDSSLATPVITGINVDSGLSAVDGITREETVDVQGTAAAGATVRLTVDPDGAVLGETTATGGVWSLSWDASALADGEYNISASIRTTGGVYSASSDYTVTLDRTAPEVVAISRFSPEAELFTATTDKLVYRVQFAEAVAGVSSSHFELATTGTAAGSIEGVIAQSASVYHVEVGSLDGIGDLALRFKAGSSEVVDVAGNPGATAFVNGAIYTRALSSIGDGIWVKAGGGRWSEASSWKDNVIADEEAEALFNTLDIADQVTVTLDTPRTVKSLVFGDTDTTSSGQWVLNDHGSAANRLTLSGGSAIAVGEGSEVVLNTRLAGTIGLTKADRGVLRVRSDSSSSLGGGLTVGDGQLIIEPGGALRVSSAGISNSPGGAHLLIDGGTLVATGMTTLNAGTGSTFTINSGTVRFEGGLRTNNSSGGVFRVRGGNFFASDLSMRRSHAGSFDYNTGLIVTGGSAELGTLNLGTDNSGASSSVEGGQLLVTGPIVLGRQSSSNRGGALRVTGGTFISNDTARGVVVTGRANNVGQLNLLGGVSLINRITLGLDATVNAGTSSVTLNGGTLYLGSGGIVKDGAAGLNSSVTLTNGVLGARDGWRTGHPVAVSAGGNVEIRTANAGANAFDISLDGVVSGSGSLTKTGAGTLALNAENSFSGTLAVNAGTLTINGSLASGEALSVNGGATLAGTGGIARIVTLNTDGTLSPAGAAAGSIQIDALTWNGGARVQASLGATSDRLVLNGALTKGSAGTYEFVFDGTPAPGSVHTVASFGATTFAASDFSYASADGITGSFSIEGSHLLFTVAAGTSGVYDEWATGLPAGSRGPTDDADGDGMANLLEFLLGRDGGSAAVRPDITGAAEIDGETYPTLTFTRRIDRGGAELTAKVYADLQFSADLGTVQLSVAPAEAGLETVVVRSAVPLSVQPDQFFRLQAVLP